VNQQRIVEHVRGILEAVGEDPTREGLLETPARVARAYEELLAGYQLDPASVLSTSFESDGYDEMVVLRGIDFYSLCEHHMLPFIGEVVIAYIPHGRVVGLSKLARLVDVFAKRLQIQERMTRQIAEAVQEHLKPVGYGVVVKATHLCMCARGVRKPNGVMVTSKIGGAIRDDARARQEFTLIAGLQPKGGT